MTQLSTVKVINEAAKNGFMIINESDFDPEIHAKFGEKKPITRAAIGGMGKDDVADLLEMHGVKPKGGLAKMRAALKQVMFV